MVERAHGMMLKNYLHNKVSSLHINCISFRTKKNTIKRQRAYMCSAVFAADEETRMDTGWGVGRCIFHFILTQSIFSILSGTRLAQSVAPALLRRSRTPTSAIYRTCRMPAGMQRIRQMHEMRSPEENGIFSGLFGSLSPWSFLCALYYSRA